MTMTVGFIGLGQKRQETDLSGKIFRLISGTCTEMAVLPVMGEPLSG